DGSVKDDSNLSGDEISVDSTFVSDLQKTYPNGLPDSGSDADHIADVNGVPAVVDTDGNVLIDGVNFPDPNFRALIMQAGGWDSGYQVNQLFESNLAHIDAIDSNQDGVLSPAELAAVTNMYLVANPAVAYDSKIADIASITGMNFFPNIDDLEVGWNKIASILPSQNQKLETLAINTVPALSALDVTNNPQLDTLVINDVSISALDLSKDVNLSTLRLTLAPNLSTVDLSNLTSLTWLTIYDATPTNKAIVGLDKCTAPTFLDLRMNNTFTAVDMTILPALQTLRVIQCPNVTSINVSGLTGLTSFYAYSNPSMTSLDVSGCTSLAQLRVQSSGLTTLDLSGLTSLTIVYAYDCTDLTSLNASDCTALSALFAYGTADSPMKMANVDITNTPALLATIPANMGFRFAYNGNITITGAAGRTFTNTTWHTPGNSITYN
ncbi:MAG: hypothetical protein FWD65_08835, partial [Coriobacteriia bacterium]|nr:hypothetical protein [Coriobacteriia bacterium]